MPFPSYLGNRTLSGEVDWLLFVLRLSPLRTSYFTKQQELFGTQRLRLPITQTSYQLLLIFDQLSTHLLAKDLCSSFGELGPFGPAGAYIEMMPAIHSIPPEEMNVSLLYTPTRPMDMVGRQTLLSTP